MEIRIKSIYKELYKTHRSKEYFAELFDVSTKTIENTVSNYKDDIIYDKKLSSYRFKNLLPKYISYESFFKLFQNSIGNSIIKNDFLSIGKSMSKEESSLSMIDTSSLSDLAQKIVSCDIAINNNNILKIEYSGNSKPKEAKYVRPHTIISTGFTYYLYASYDEKNEKNIGKYRSLGFNGMGEISLIDYVNNANFRIDKTGNAYGLYEKEKYVTLKLEPYSANFFKKEGLLQKENFDFIIEDDNNAILINMYYNDDQEIINLIQQWMPQISIQNNINLKEKIYLKIKSNYEALIKS
ncbi:MAG: WYL domain-containing protein [Sulfurimonas sp.]|uniref:WYL domain-containing protein n=1 Tax=Sulfurimonas sp. TaxID=2022749 RepID=UPI00261CD4B4|nr:WYL domain-containing protein [Sulfurimonas sp.]MDD5372928.1 WYL domain-containing protein [Sulfurimonas sp.]